MRLVALDFDGTLAEERPPQALTGVPEHPEVIEQFLTHHADPHTEVFVVTGRHMISRAAIVTWIKQVAGIDFSPARVYTRWDIDPATGPTSKLANLRQLVRQWLPLTLVPHTPEVIVYDNDRAMLAQYYHFLHSLAGLAGATVPPLHFYLNWVDASGHVEDITSSLGHAQVTQHESPKP